jgi:hypothetical protein
MTAYGLSYNVASEVHLAGTIHIFEGSGVVLRDFPHLKQEIYSATLK